MTLKEQYAKEVGPQWDIFGYAEWLEARIAELEKENDQLVAESGEDFVKAEEQLAEKDARIAELESERDTVSGICERHMERIAELEKILPEAIDMMQSAVNGTRPSTYEIGLLARVRSLLPKENEG